MPAAAPLLLPASTLIRPQRVHPRRTLLHRTAHILAGVIQRRPAERLYQAKRFTRKVLALESSMTALSDAEIDARVLILRRELVRSACSGPVLIDTFALVREVIARELGLRLFASQILGGVCLFRGCVAQMATGEGKTLTASLPACAAALAGVPVHVITVNDYLTARDAQTTAPIYHRLGISNGHIVHEHDLQQRIAAYASDVTYCTNKELVFDYLKDRLVIGENASTLNLHADRLCGQHPQSSKLMLRGLHFAIVDEADSILIDEARTPLIISSSTPGNHEEEQIVIQALALARNLRRDRDFNIAIKRRQVELTESGCLDIEQGAELYGPYWCGRARREQLVRQALSALYLFDRDWHYLVHDGKIQIIDEHTGRVMADRTWERGLQQLIECKENVDLSLPRETVAQISYQRFFRQYYHLSGMTGTAEEVAAELWGVYGLPVVSIPLNRPSQRERYPLCLFPSLDQKWAQVVVRIEQMHREARPILVGTSSVEASEHLSELLNARGLTHQVLNAKQGLAEAQIIAQAGEAGQITVATSMAGRGTDIKLAPGVAAHGGLHVILTEHHEAVRIDHQLEGRCGRQGDRGSFEVIVSLHDSLVQGRNGGLLIAIARSRFSRHLGLQSKLGQMAMQLAQIRLGRAHASLRRTLLRDDERRIEMMAFAGKEN